MATVCACIDIGTNTTRLLVARRTADGLRTVAVERAFVALADGGSAAVEELLGVVAAQVAHARAQGAEHVRVVGTAGLRGRPDAEGLCARLHAAAGLPVEVLTAAQEARLAFLGATAALPAGPGDVAVVDVGGGSTEVAVGAIGAAQPRWWASAAAGSAVLTAAHVRHDPPNAGELDAMRSAAAAAVAPLAVPPCTRALAVGGSAASMPRIVGPVVTPDAVERALRRLTTGPADTVAAALGLHPRRVRVLPAGLLLLAAAGTALGRPLEVADGGLREGILLDMAS